jgi:hypothetical protein
MRATITVFKSEVALKHLLVEKMKSLCDEVNELGDAYILTPQQGHFFEILHILGDSQITYATQFNIVDDLPSIS